MFDNSMLEELRKKKFQVFLSRNPSLRVESALCYHARTGVTFTVIRRRGNGAVSVFWSPCDAGCDSGLGTILKQWAAYFQELLGGAA